MTVTADLALLLHDPDSGGRLVDGHLLPPLLGGAQLVDLTLAGRVELDARMRVLDRSPVDDPVLDEALDRLPEGTTARRAVDRLARDAPGRVLGHLAATGVVTARQRRVLGLVPVRRWPLRDRARRDAPLARLRAVLLDGDEPTGADAATIALVDAGRVLRPVLGAGSARALHRRALQVTDHDRAGEATRGAVATAQAIRLAILAAVASQATAPAS